MNASGSGDGTLQGEQWFLYVVSGKAKVDGTELSQGGFAYLPPGTHYKIRGAAKDTQLLVFAKQHALLDGEKVLQFFSGHEHSIADAPFLGDSRARLKTLIPDCMAMELAVNIFTYDPGATLPFVETHVMEHGMYFLEGGGVYRLDEDWHPVTQGDALWIAPYCPQWFIAAGPGPARYIYYKDVNRIPR
jgi:(S)-ureidoglycine aminohydrolase